MTILETERLVRRISSLLLDNVGQPSAPKLAEDFASACRAANLRLQQCEAMIREGDRYQAIQSAETRPNLLDWITVLEFQGVDGWRQYCEKNGLPLAERLDRRSVEALNECYAQGIPGDHPLYAAYRRAVLLRNDEDALKALQSIVRLNPSDANAAAELERFDGKVLIAKLRHLEDMVAGGAPDLVLAQIEAIEGFGFKNRPYGDIWRKAQAIRCASLLEEVEKLKGASLWLEAVAKLDTIRRLRDEFQVELPPATSGRLELIENWARDEQEKDQSEREFQSRLAELNSRLPAAEASDDSAWGMNAAEQEEEIAGLHEAWSELGKCGRPVSPEVAAGYQKRLAVLEAEIARRIASKRRTQLAVVAAALVVGVISVGIAFGVYHARDLAGQLDQAVQRQEARTAKRLFDRAQLPQNRWLGGGALSAAAAKAKDFAAQEDEHLKKFDEAFGQLPKELKGVSLETIETRLARVKEAFQQLAADLQKENEAKLASYEQRWKAFHNEQNKAANADYEQLVARVEEGLKDLNYELPEKEAESRTAALSEAVRRIKEYDPNLRKLIGEESRGRANKAQESFTAYDGELKRLLEAESNLKKAAAVDQYTQALGSLASSKFSNSPWVKAASDVQALKPDDESALRFLLGATNQTLWALIKANQSRPFISDRDGQASNEFNKLYGDPAINAHHQRLVLYFDSQGTNTAEWLTTDILKKPESWTGIRVYMRSTSPDACSFTNIFYKYEREKLLFTIKIDPHYPNIEPNHVDGPSSLHETDCLSSVGLPEAIGPGHHSKSLLEVLEALKNSRDGSPVFRAYLFLRLAELTESEPEVRGLVFAPEVRKHHDEIERITGASLKSGDWFVPAKANQWTTKLEQFFDSVKGVSYTNQAEGLLRLDREVVRSGLRYIGFVGCDGTAMLVHKPRAGELVGYRVESTRPALLGPVETGWEMALGKPGLKLVPLSPLFVLPDTRDALLTKAGVSRADPLFKDTLPPLFQSAPGGKTAP